LAAKDQSIFPWKNLNNLPWQVIDTKHQYSSPISFPIQSYLPIIVRLSQNGNVQITDNKGLVHARLGLPGRPQKVWRDWGIRVNNVFDPMLFPNHSPLQQGIASILTNVLDFRSRLEGLLWILHDDINILAVINPATSQAIYLLLPSEQELKLNFYPDRIDVSEEQLNKNHKRQTTWSLYWLELLPYFIQLGIDKRSNEVQGTAFEPFKK
jgi:hypothetical protein